MVPVVMLLLLVAVQCALWSHAAAVVQTAASEGDRVSRVLGGGGPAGVARATGVLQQSGGDVVGTSVQVTVLPNDQEEMTVQGSAMSILPGLRFPVSSTQVGPVQEFREAE